MPETLIFTSVSQPRWSTDTRYYGYHLLDGPSSLGLSARARAPIRNWAWELPLFNHSDQSKIWKPCRAWISAQNRQQESGKRLQGQRGNPIDTSSLLVIRTLMVSEHYVQGNKYLIFSINKYCVLVRKWLQGISFFPSAPLRSYCPSASSVT